MGKVGAELAMIHDQPFNWMVEDFVFLRDKATYFKPFDMTVKDLFKE